MRYGWVIMLAATLLPLAALSAVIEEGVDYKGWKCVVMKNADTEVVIAPAIGGRIIQYRANGVDWFWVNPDLAGQVFPVSENSNMEIWKNYGGDKLWPAPQGWDRKDQWPGPGDEVIEAPYTYEVLKVKGPEVKIKLIGNRGGGWAGVQFTRTLTLRDGSNQVEEEIVMKNVSDRTVSWGIWEVAQMDWTARGKPAGDKDYNEAAYLVLPMNPQSRWPEKYRVMFGEAFSFNWQPDYEKGRMIVKFMNMVGKIVMDISAGWGAMVDPATGNTFVLRFPYVAKATYPDGGNYETWVAGKGEFVHKHKLRVAPDDPKSRLIEMEVLGPKTTLKPGEETKLKVSWQVYKGGLTSVPGIK
jgi:hypothetical protein